MDTLADEVSFAQSQTPTHRRTRAWSPLRVQRIHVKGQMNRRVVANMSESHLDHAADSVSTSCQCSLQGQLWQDIPVDIVHTERLDSMLPQQFLLAAVNIPQPDIDQLPQIDPMILL